jgi:hypothetical protein
MSDVQAEVTAAVEQVVEQPVEQLAAQTSPEFAQAVVEAHAAAAEAFAALHPAEGHLASIEAIALTWGGDIGIMLRNLVGKIREVL